MAISLSTYYNTMRAMSSAISGQNSLLGNTAGSSQGIYGTDSNSGFVFEAALADMITQSKQAYGIIADKQAEQTTAASSTQAGNQASASQTAAEDTSCLNQSMFRLLSGALGSSSSMGLGLYQALATLKDSMEKTNTSASAAAGSNAAASQNQLADEVLKLYEQMKTSSGVPSSIQESMLSTLNESSAASAGSQGLDSNPYIALSQGSVLSNFFSAVNKIY